MLVHRPESQEGADGWNVVFNYVSRCIVALEAPGAPGTHVDGVDTKYVFLTLTLRLYQQNI